MAAEITEENAKMIGRVRKLRGQLAAVERSLAEHGECAQQLMQLAALRGGINSLMREVLETHIRFHLTDGAKEKIAPELAEDLLGLVRSYLK
jgi:DNA-binding FrmR family transcriptional regulator